jgi:uncharacterized protein YjlB
MRSDRFLLQENGWVPNNARLPVLVYRAVIDGQGEPAALWFEEVFDRHGWPAQWRDGIFDYHHYHSTAHEALGIATGSARLMLGGPGGREIAVAAGDALVLPTGIGHCALSASDDFLVVGAYPKGAHWDICREAPTAEARRRMCDMPIPAQDPVAGAAGMLGNLWR